MKKQLSLTLAAVMLAGLTACGASAPAASSESSAPASSESEATAEEPSADSELDATVDEAEQALSDIGSIDVDKGLFDVTITFPADFATDITQEEIDQQVADGKVHSGQINEDGSVTYAKPVRIPGAVSLSMDANGEIEPFYADNIAYYVVNNNSGYEGDLEIALIPESFLTDIMHEELDGNGVLAENANVELEHFAFLFEFDGDQRHIRHVLYNCVASRPSIEGETNEDSKEVKTDTLNLQATPLANGYVKAKTGTNTTDDVYNKWYDAVYEPQAEAVDTEDTSHTEEPQG